MSQSMLQALPTGSDIALPLIREKFKKMFTVSVFYLLTPLALVPVFGMERASLDISFDFNVFITCGMGMRSSGGMGMGGWE